MVGRSGQLLHLGKVMNRDPIELSIPFEDLLSAPRLGTYFEYVSKQRGNGKLPQEMLSPEEMSAFASDHERRREIAAYRLYFWDSCVAASFWPSVSFTEVALRNAINDSLCDYFGVYRENGWYDLVCKESDFSQQILENPTMWKREVEKSIILTDRDYSKFQKELKRALDRLRGRKRAGDFTVAKMPLGIWAMLLSNGDSSPGKGYLNYEQTLWEPCLKNAFPNFSGKRAHLREKIRSFSVLRNRIAHHEHLLGKNLQGYIETIENILEYIDGPSADFFSDFNRIQEMIEAKGSFLSGRIYM
ncbi:hypothetical protein QPX15_09225 [Corynebacterium propinquum]|nr:hypothetical protein [Corynebacterium propinquum]